MALSGCNHSSGDPQSDSHQAVVSILFVDRIVVGGDPADRLVDLEAFEFGQEADMPHVHAENRHLGAVDESGGRQTTPISYLHCVVVDIRLTAQ